MNEAGDKGGADTVFSWKKAENEYGRSLLEEEKHRARR